MLVLFSVSFLLFLVLLKAISVPSCVLGKGDSDMRKASVILSSVFISVVETVMALGTSFIASVWLLSQDNSNKSDGYWC